jgi:hypothetical protein
MLLPPGALSSSLSASSPESAVSRRKGLSALMVLRAVLRPRAASPRLQFSFMIPSISPPAVGCLGVLSQDVRQEFAPHGIVTHGCRRTRRRHIAPVSDSSPRHRVSGRHIAPMWSANQSPLECLAEVKMPRAITLRSIRGRSRRSWGAGLRRPTEFSAQHRLCFDIPAIAPSS